MGAKTSTSSGARTLDNFFDVPDTVNPPLSDYSSRMGAGAMKARATGRVWKQVNGAQAFSRVGAPKLKGQIQSVVTWLAELDDREFRSVAAGTMTLADLDPGMREVIDSIVGSHQDVPFVLLDNEDNTTLRVSPSLRMTYTDPNTGASKTISVEPERSPQSPNLGTNGARRPTVPLDRPEAGPLDFGRGAVMSLHSALDLAEKAFWGAL